MKTSKFSFGKHERLRSKKAIQELFQQGKSGFVYPLAYKFFRADLEGSGVEILLSVPKKNIRFASGRNQIKRWLREAYRQNKIELNELVQEKEIKLNIVLLYAVKNREEYAKIERSMKKVLQQIMEKLI